MAAVIQSAIPTKATIVGASRTDLRSGDVVTLTAFDLSHTTYSWTLADSPETKDGTASAAVLSAATGAGPITFTADNEGTYLIRLIADAGLGTESTQFVALRYQTVFADLSLIAAGERRDETGVIPVDADPEGWARGQNINLLRLLHYLQKVSTSGRTLTVDANRGIDSTNPPNDSTIAEGFADYSNLTDAIAAAVLLVPAPSVTDPVIIRVFASFLEEDVAFAPHVHVIGMGPNAAHSSDRSVVVRGAHTANTGAGEFCFLSDITLESTAVSVDSVLEKSGDGTLYLNHCVVVQNGADANQGPAYTHSGGWVIGKDCSILSNAGSAYDRVALLQDTASTDMLWIDSTFTGPSGIALAPSDLPDMNAEFRGCQVESTFGASALAFALQTNSELLVLDRCDLSLSSASTKALDIHPGAGVHGSDVIVEVRWCRLVGDLDFDATGIVGSKSLFLGASDYQSLNIIGVLTAQTATVQGTSLLFDNTFSGISSENVQDALDHVFTILKLTGIGGYSVSLDTAYNGVNAVTALPGTGNGRQILADSGAVIIRSSNPGISSPAYGETNGWLQVEGKIQVGAVGSPEIDIDPNSYGVGPQILGGALVFPDLAAAAPHRAIPAFIIQANATGAALYHNYNLLLETRSDSDASFGEIGRVMLRGGDSLNGGVGAPADAGTLYFQAGSGYAAFGDPGEIVLSPGYSSALASTGKVRLTNPSTGVAASLVAVNAFGGGVTGDIRFYVSGVGIVTASILDTDTLALVQGKLTALPGLACAVGAGNDPIEITTVSVGTNAEVYFTEDSAAGALNVALGNFAVGSGATFTAGAWTEDVGVGATGADELTIFGDLIVVGSFSTGSSGAFSLARKTIAFADSPYTVLNTDHYIGVNTLGGAVVINLPVALPGSASGRELLIKDETGNAAAANITIQIAGGALIDNAAFLLLSADWASATLIANGDIGAATRWYIV